MPDVTRIRRGRSRYGERRTVDYGEGARAYRWRSVGRPRRIGGIEGGAPVDDANRNGLGTGTELGYLHGSRTCPLRCGGCAVPERKQQFGGRSDPTVTYSQRLRAPRI
ncbi:MAG: hypothetical protein PVSMB4_00800 [Ktedonobacterales bacterium]